MQRGGNGDRSKALWALGGLSAAITAHQLSLMQVLGYVHWHHFAYMVVAVALLGFGAAGTVLTLWRRPLVARAATLAPWLAAGAGVAMPLGLFVSQTTLLAFDLHLLFVQPSQWLSLAAVYGCLLPGFFLGGLGISLVLTVEARQAGRFYFASLLGSGVGGILGLAALHVVLPPQLPLLGAALALSAGWIVAPGHQRIAVGVMAVGVLAGGFWASRAQGLRASEFKPITRVLALPDAKVVDQWPSVHGWVQIVTAPALRPAPALSLAYFGELPPHPAVFVNGYGHGSLLRRDHATSAGWMDYTTAAVAYAAFTPSRVLLLEPTPGGSVALARQQGARAIVVAEPHASLAAFLARGGNPALEAPEWVAPEVTVWPVSGRRLLRLQSDARFDLIVFPEAGTAGGAGVTSATEQFLLTREAVQEAWRRLAPGGALSVTAPMEFPVRPALRLLATLVEALEEEGVVSVASHLTAVRGWTSVTFLAHRAPLTDSQVAAVRAFCEERSFDPLLLPGLAADERNALNVWPVPDFFRQADQLLGPERERLYSEYPFRLRPATDERPWFGQFLKWSRLDELAEAFGEARLPYFELGTVMVALTFVQLFVLAVLCILLPLSRLGRVRGRRAGTLLYFSGLGAGFMLVEIGLMLRLHSWLGNPLTAAAVVLVGLLVFAGLGSLFSERLPAEAAVRGRITLACLAVIAGVSALLLLSSPVAWSPAWQIAIALGLMVPLGLVMGLAFPVGLRDLERREPTQVPWAWGINGCVSVTTPAGAMLLAMEGGVALLFALAVLAYGLAWVGAQVDRRAARAG